MQVRTFRSFLRKNECEQQFDAAFYSQCGANYLDETLAGILVIDEFFFGRCFDWSKTPEGRTPERCSCISGRQGLFLLQAACIEQRLKSEPSG